MTEGERGLLAEALRRGEETRDVMEDALVSFGRWVLVNVFKDDAASALADRTQNPVWLQLVHHAGGPKLRLGRKLLYVALHIAARDKRITDEAWRSLEPGRKQLLLPLGDEASMREAARHVTAMKLSQRATEAYVASLRAAAGAPPKARVSARSLATRIRRFRDALGTKSQAAQIERALRDADPDDRKAATEELRALRDWASEMLRARRSGAR
jgi:hypothetical protein